MLCSWALVFGSILGPFWLHFGLHVRPHFALWGASGATFGPNRGAFRSSWALWGRSWDQLGCRKAPGDRFWTVLAPILEQFGSILDAFWTLLGPFLTMLAPRSLPFLPSSPSFLPSFLPAFRPSFLPSFRPSFLPSFSSFPSFLPSALTRRADTPTGPAVKMSRAGHRKGPAECAKRFNNNFADTSLWESRPPAIGFQ